VWTLAKGKWTQKSFGRGKVGTLSISPVEGASDSDEYWQIDSDFLQPSTLSLGALGKPATMLKTSPTFFEAKGLAVSQHFATSKDGTKVPYFQVSRKNLALDGKAPTLLYGYGGFEVSLTPGYDPISGAAWDERGGVYVVANIRGGGEYGPAWHQAALRHDRQRAYDDFIAVAEDLIARKVTSPQKLGIAGGSNGGLLTGVMLTQRPDLFGAVVCSVPLLDMKRYHTLLAGASWMEEYGDPDKPDDWAVLAKYSPYQNVKRTTKYPRVLFTSSTLDDRVHPGHARKMVARMLEHGHDVLYYENIEGGHGGAANNEQIAFMQALEYTFLAKQLGLD
jgi:prolyl oligopeptidase